MTTSQPPPSKNSKASPSGQPAVNKEALLKNYLSTNHILIVDTVSSGRTSLASVLVQLGGNRQKMSLVGTLSDAHAEIKKTKPKIIFTDFTLGSHSGLDLLQEQKAVFEKEKIKDSVFVLVTGNASQSTVARAA